MGYVKSENERGSPTSSRHHHHHHHRRSAAKAPREPSINSLSSSDISSETSSAIHRKTTPKIAAVIIAAIIVIAALVGITIYLIDADRFEKQAIAIEQEENANVYQSPSIRPDPAAAAVDYQTYRDESSVLMEKHLSDHKEQNTLAKDEESNASTTVRYRFGKDPEGPHDAIYEEYYDEESKSDSPNKDLVVDGHGGSLSKEFYPHQRDDIMPPNQMQRAGGHMRGLHRDRQGGVFQRVTYQNNQPYGAKLPPSSQDQHWSPSLRAPETEQEVPSDGREKIYNMEPFVDQQGDLEGGPGPQGKFPRRMLRPGQRFRRPGTLISEPVGGSLLKTDASIQVDDEAMLPKISSDQILPLGDDIKHHPLPPSGSRGGIHVPVESGVDDLIEHPNLQDSAGITTLDRRPGRPIFHHMGPGQTRPINRNMLMRRRQQAMLQRRMGMFPPGGEPQDPIQQAERLLSKFDRIVTLAESEMKILKQIGENITSEGKDINLWEVMSAVNNTIKDNPDSALSKLMDRFYNKYLMETNQIEDNAFPMTDQIYEKSLSSLLFLSFGIFLLNSVNDLIAHKGLDQGRSFTNNNNTLILKDLLTKHDELLDVFPNVIKDRIDENMAETNGSLIQSHEPPTINSFLRLLMNLMNAYNSGDEEEVECIWALYCHQLNQQAALGGMVSSVARINSVGMRVLLKQVPSSHAIRLMFKNLMHWKDLDCETMFPTCSAQIRMKLDDQSSSTTTSSAAATTSTTTTSSTAYQSR